MRSDILAWVQRLDNDDNHYEDDDDYDDDYDDDDYDDNDDDEDPVEFHPLLPRQLT